MYKNLLNTIKILLLFDESNGKKKVKEEKLICLPVLQCGYLPDYSSIKGSFDIVDVESTRRI